MLNLTIAESERIAYIERRPEAELLAQFDRVIDEDTLSEYEMNEVRRAEYTISEMTEEIDKRDEEILSLQNRVEQLTEDAINDNALIASLEEDLDRMRRRMTELEDHLLECAEQDAKA